MSLWKGPEVDGITQSLLSKFIVCRERFKLLVIDGLVSAPRFSHALEYGNMWHLCEECLANKQPYEGKLKEYAQELAKEYPLQSADVEKWYQVCRLQFPIYVQYWKKHPDVKKREPLYAEDTFSEPIELPSGRIVRLRGKFDSVDAMPNARGRKKGIYLQENKTKGEINEQEVANQLLWDLQTGTYLVALRARCRREGIDLPVSGVRYNVIRRPLAGGRHSIRPFKPTKSNPRGETSSQFYVRLAGLIKGEPEFFFMRWRVEFTEKNIDDFERLCLYPILEMLWDWWEWINLSSEDQGELVNSFHYRYPYGVWNPMDRSGVGELDQYMNNGSKLGLVVTDNLYKEL